jgi:hypothetical protein
MNECILYFMIVTTLIRRISAILSLLCSFVASQTVSFPELKQFAKYGKLQFR